MKLVALTGKDGRPFLVNPYKVVLVAPKTGAHDQEHEALLIMDDRQEIEVRESFSEVSRKLNFA